MQNRNAAAELHGFMWAKIDKNHAKLQRDCGITWFLSSAQYSFLCRSGDLPPWQRGIRLSHFHDLRLNRQSVISVWVQVSLRCRVECSM